MLNYLIRRLILLPITLFFIVLVNFVIVNLAPGDPVTLTDVSQQGAKRDDKAVAFGSDDKYLQFREFYGLTLPILFNTWPYTSKETVDTLLWSLVHRQKSPEDPKELEFKTYETMRISFGDRARFIMPILRDIATNPQTTPATQRMAVRFFVRGGTRQAYLGPNLPPEKKAYNRKVADDNSFLSTLLISTSNTPEVINDKLHKLQTWYDQNEQVYTFAPTAWQKVSMLLFETRFVRYMSRVLRLDFGTMRNDSNKTVVSEVVSRFKYSLTLSILPMIITFFLCLLFGTIMAVYQHHWPDYSLNLLFLILYAIPIFVVAPFLIEKVALNHFFPFTQTPIPITGFTSPDSVYDDQTSLQRLFDIFQHILLPLIAIIYGTLAAQARLSRTAILEVLHQDYVRTARAKGLSSLAILIKHVGRNASITIVTSIAGSLGIILGGSLIVETLFGINGFGKFFYDAVINRDYNVIMFSALAGSFLTLLGYLTADIAYTTLDPRVTLD
ncbi:MAG: ABC transporter permease [Parachlamydiaceae bacterium]|nr:ABC transporter permease [Parachlamydiaceae bacterium]